MKPNGFMLMEFLVYLALFSMIMLLVTSLVSQTWKPAMEYTRKQTCCIDLVTAHDCFIRDIHMAKAEKNFWQYVSEHAIVFKSGWRDIGWLVHNNNLVRIEGAYDSKKNEWSKKSTSLIVRNIEKVQFHLLGQPEINYVQFTFGRAQQEIKSEIALINGTVPWKIKKQ